MDYLVVCIGNRDGGDDAVGPYIADRLKEEAFENVIDCGTVPENFTGIIKQKNPKKLIIIDAVDMKLKPGEIRIVPKEKIGVMTISTHGIPLSIFIDYLEKYIKKINFIGIQPKTMYGNITKKVKKSAEELINIIKNNYIDKITRLD